MKHINNYFYCGKGAKSIISFDVLSQVINEEWNNVKIVYAEPWEIPWIVPVGERDDYEIHLMLKGKGRFYVGDREYNVTQGDIICLHSMEGNSFKAEEGSFRWIFATIKIKNPGSLEKIRELNRLLKEEVFPLRIGDVPEIQQMFYQMHREISTQSQGYMFRLKLLLGNLILKIMDCSRQDDGIEDMKRTVSRNARELVDRAIMFLQKNYNREIMLDEIGRMLNLHPRYLCTVFRQVTGQTINEFLREIRLEKAKRLLQYTTLSITEIAFETGFNNSQYFSRVFSQSEGMEPRTFRKIRSNVISSGAIK